MCSERLIEEESHNFDKKLNDENLTKCVQTLKHMYYGKNFSLSILIALRRPKGPNTETIKRFSDFAH